MRTQLRYGFFWKVPNFADGLWFTFSAKSVLFAERQGR